MIVSVVCAPAKAVLYPVCGKKTKRDLARSRSLGLRDWHLASGLVSGITVETNLLLFFGEVCHVTSGRLIILTTARVRYGITSGMSYIGVSQMGCGKIRIVLAHAVNNGDE